MSPLCLYKGFLQVCSFSFSSTEHKFLILMKSSLSIFSSLVLYLISYHHIQSHLDFLMLSSRSFILLHFTFKPMIHFELNFVKSVRSVFRFFFPFLHTDVHFFQHHLLNSFPLSHCLFCFVKCHLTIFMWPFFWLPIPSHWCICLFFYQYHTVLITVKVKVLVTQSCPTLCDPMNCSPPGSSVHGILQARILEWVAILFFRESSQPRDQTWVSRIADRFFTIWAMRKALWLL